jgi:alcohol dehydrogenase (cytochrome c)
MNPILRAGAIGLMLAFGASVVSPLFAGEKKLDKNPVEKLSFKELLDASEAQPENWAVYGGGYDNQRYSRLATINADNVAQLTPAWIKTFDVKHGFETTPLVINGVLYMTTGGHTSLWALDAKTGEEHWHFKHAIPEDVAACCDRVNRGLAAGEGKVFFATLDAQLIALDAKTGELAWKKRIGDTREGHTATGAPLIVKDKVVVGISGGEYGVRGYLDAYDIETGERAWRFWTVPGPGEAGHDSWGGTEAWRTGGGTTWVTGAYDPDLDLLYWTTGNPSPDMNGQVRPGDNLYTDAVVALNPGDGTLVWHFQWTPHDVWDYDGVNEVVLADLEMEGGTVPALIHADKNGFFYALNRETGEFLYAKEFARQTWAKEIDPKTGRPAVDEMAIPGPSNTPVCPGPAGAKEWNHMAFSPETGLAYVPVIENCAMYRTSQAFFQRGMPYWGGDANVMAFGPAEKHGFLKAINAATGEEAWNIRSDMPVMSGVLATAGGLVFWGEADGTFRATAAESGEDLWTYNVGSGIHAPPITFGLDGEQYVAIAAGWGGWVKGFAPELMEQPKGHTLAVFKLP